MYISSTRINSLKLSALLFFGFAIASSWLIFPYFVQGVVMSADEGDGFHAGRDFYPVECIGLDAD